MSETKEVKKPKNLTKGEVKDLLRKKRHERQMKAEAYEKERDEIVRLQKEAYNAEQSKRANAIKPEKAKRDRLISAALGLRADKHTKALAEKDEAIRPAKEAYDEAVAPFLKKMGEVMEAADVEAQKTVDAARAAYNQKAAKLAEEYKKALQDLAEAQGLDLENITTSHEKAIKALDSEIQELALELSQREEALKGKMKNEEAA